MKGSYPLQVGEEAEKEGEMPGLTSLPVAGHSSLLIPSGIEPVAGGRRDPAADGGSECVCTHSGAEALWHL